MNWFHWLTIWGAFLQAGISHALELSIDDDGASPFFSVLGDCSGKLISYYRHRIHQERRRTGRTWNVHVVCR